MLLYSSNFQFLGSPRLSGSALLLEARNFSPRLEFSVPAEICRNIRKTRSRNKVYRFARSREVIVDSMERKSLTRKCTALTQTYNTCNTYICVHTFCRILYWRGGILRFPFRRNETWRLRARLRIKNDQAGYEKKKRGKKKNQQNKIQRGRRNVQTVDEYRTIYFSGDSSITSLCGSRGEKHTLVL